MTNVDPEHHQTVSVEPCCKHLEGHKAVGIFPNSERAGQHGATRSAEQLGPLSEERLPMAACAAVVEVANAGPHHIQLCS